MNIYKKIVAKQMANQKVVTVCHDKTLYRTRQLENSCRFKTCTSLRVEFNGELRNNYTLKTPQHNKHRSESDLLPNFTAMTQAIKPLTQSTIMTQHVQNFFKRPIVPFLTPKPQNIELPLHFARKSLDHAAKNPNEMNYSHLSHKNVGTQTDYRESETQTVPWEPPFQVRPGHSPEVLTLAHLTWEHGLPAGVHEVEIINRMRIRKVWESILPPPDTPENIKIRTKILTGLEADEWAFRESEIQFIMNLRVELMEKLSRERENDQRKKIQERILRLQDNLTKFKEKQVNSIRSNLKRDLRKLWQKHQNWQKLKKRETIVERPALNLYAPQMKYGIPVRDETLNKKELLKKIFVDKLIDAEKENTTLDWLPTYEELKAIKPKPEPSDLCIRATKWTEEKLEQLHQDLKAIRLKTKEVQAPSLIKQKYEAPSLPSTPLRSDKHSVESTIARSAALIQRIVKGRAVQCMVVEGRDRCRELIEELYSTHALEEHELDERQGEKEKMMDLQKEQSDKILQEDRLCEILNSLEGMTVSGMLDFLSKELIRLQDERRAHAFALLAERERSKREAEETGRRQLDQNRRRELDEMFRHIVKVNQDSAEVYLEDIIKESIEWVSEKAAKEYISELCDKVDEAAQYATENATELEQEEMVADMIYNFILPEVEKQKMRKKLKEQQDSYLRIAHQAIYEKILDLPPIQISTEVTDIEEELPMETKERDDEVKEEIKSEDVDIDET